MSQQKTSKKSLFTLFFDFISWPFRQIRKAYFAIKHFFEGTRGGGAGNNVLTNIQVRLEEKKLFDQLGKGSFGLVLEHKDSHKAALEEDQEKSTAIDSEGVYAVKELAQTSSEQGMIEATALKRCKHANIVNLIGYFPHKGLFYIVMEKWDSSLSKYKGNFSDELILNISSQILLALAYLKEKSYVHLDVKPANVLVRGSDDSGAINVCLSDFGSVSEIGKFIPRRGTQHYMAPEISALEEGESIRASSEQDVFSFGILILELVRRMKKILLANENWKEQMLLKCGVFKPLAEPCVKDDPEERISIKEAQSVLQAINLSSPS